MKRGLLLPLSVAAAMVLPACTKHLNLGRLAGQEVKFCPVEQLAMIDPFHNDTVYIRIVIHYNAAGNPVEMLHAMGGGTLDLQDYHFRYDRASRLTDYIMNQSGSGAAAEWHTYSYPARGVVLDSVYGQNDPAQITAPRPNRDSYIGMTIHLLDLDGRIVEDRRMGFGNSLKDTIHFRYDAWGNMIRPGVDYDNKVNPYLTNDVWRFVYEDYSVNNPLPENNNSPMLIPQYDAHGLPQILQTFGYIYLFNYQFITGLQVVYGCDVGPKQPAGE